MKAIVRKDIDIKNKEVAEKCYQDFTEHIIMDIQDFLMTDYDIDYDTAGEIADNISKDDFIEIVSNYLEKAKNDYFCGKVSP